MPKVRVGEKRKKSNCTQCARIRSIKDKHGITEEEYDERLQRQENLCGLCKRPLGSKPPHLDHNHKTGKLREFLHHHCNSALGMLEDNPALLRLAAEYLEKHTGDQDVQS